MNIKRLMDLGCYRGLRHRKGLPVRGQRTHTNARTRKGPRKGQCISRRGGGRQDRSAGSMAESAEARRSRQGQAEEEGQEEHPDRHRSHPVDVQQHDRHDHRRLAATSSRGRRAGARGFKGSRKSTPFAAQLAAEDAAKKAMEHGMRTVAVFVKGPGSGRESALRALQRRGLQDHAHPRRHARSRTTAAGRPSAAASDHEGQSNMARYTGPVCRLCRREDMKLFLKGERCYTDKCGYERRAYPPGQHGQGAAASSRTTACSCARSRRSSASTASPSASSAATTTRPSRMKGVTGENLLAAARAPPRQRRLPPGLRRDHAEARQLVRHGHFTVNGKKVNIPSYLVRAGDVDRGAREVAEDRAHRRGARRRRPPRRAAVARARQGERSRGASRQLPSREDLTMPIREQLIVELYSK